MLALKVNLFIPQQLESFVVADSTISRCKRNKSDPFVSPGSDGKNQQRYIKKDFEFGVYRPRDGTPSGKSTATYKI